MKRFVVTLIMVVLLTISVVTTVSAEKYHVKKGDSLLDIAQEHHTTVNYLIDINQLTSGFIHPNQLLQIGDFYTVKQGDNLWDIAKKFGVSVKDIKKWNDLDTKLLHIGQDLELIGVDVEKVEKKQKKIQKKQHEKQQARKTQKKKTKQEASNDNVNGKTIHVKATAYTANCSGCSGVTKTGVNLINNPGKKVIAVDPNVIPLGSKVYVEGYGYAVAADTGSAIKGSRIDVFIPNEKRMKDWGVKHIKVTILR